MENTVFIIDDDASVRDALGLMLGLHGFRCTLFADAASFLAAWRADWHGCLIIDIRMKGMDGLGLQRELLARGCAIPVVIITGHGDTGTAREAFRAAAIDFLEKPLDETRLIQAINEAFSRQSATLQTRRQRQRRLEPLDGDLVVFSFRRNCRQMARRLHVLRIDAKRRKVGFEGAVLAAEKVEQPAAGIMPPVIVIHEFDQAN